MSKYVCSICGYVHEGDNAPEACPQCKAPASKFLLQQEEAGLTWAAEHVIASTEGIDPEIVEGQAAVYFHQRLLHRFFQRLLLGVSQHHRVIMDH